MNTLPTTQSTNGVIIPAGFAWGRLHSERESVCAALLGEANTFGDFIISLPETEPADSSARAVEWKHRELLRTRLRQIDDALDRVISGFYGHCSDCGKPIEEKRLRADLAVSHCLNCQHLDEPELTTHTL